MNFFKVIDKSIPDYMIDIKKYKARYKKIIKVLKDLGDFNKTNILYLYEGKFSNYGVYVCDLKEKKLFLIHIHIVWKV